MAPPRSSAPRILGLAALGLLGGVACNEDPCGPHAWWCDRPDDAQWQQRTTPVEDAVLVDFDGDGADEAVTLSRDGMKLTLARGPDAPSFRSSLVLTERPVALAALPGEVAVALAYPPQVAIFGMDADGRLARRRDIPLSDDPTRLDAADLDGDGAPELVIAVRDARAIAVVDPRTGSLRTYPAGQDPVDLEVGDVDGDGRLDVVVIDFFGEALHVLRGAGDGTLKPPVASPSSAGEFYLALVDHDGDGDLDAVARNVSAQTILFHRNDGRGGFSSPTALPIALATQPTAGLAASPATASGLVSVSVPQGDAIATWVGKGAAWLGRVEGWLADTRWVGKGPGDLLLVGLRNYLAALEWESGTTPIEVWRSGLLPPPDNARALATGDLDDDHLLDFAAASGKLLHAFHGRADRGFDQELLLELEATPTAMVIVDVSGDGRDDIVFNEADEVRALIAGEDGPFLAGPRVPLDIPARALLPLRVGPDLPLALTVLPLPRNYTEDEVPGARVLRFGPDGSPTTTAAIDDIFVDAAAAVDFDADGVDELLLLGRRDEALVVTHLAPAGDAYEPTFEYDLEELLGRFPSRPRDLTAADLDGDGDLEVLFGFNESRARIDGLADGAPVATVEEQPAPTHLVDFDGDGLLDAVRLDFQNLDYQRGHGDGTFAAETVRHWFSRGVEFALASRPDGQFDIAELAYDTVASHIVREVMRPVATDITFAMNGAALDLLAADLDADGDDDLALLTEHGIAWSWGSETEPLARGEGVTFLGWSSGLAVGDLDGDGSAEALTVDNFIGELRAFHTHPRLAEQPLLFETPRNAAFSGLAVADVDGDAHPDVLAFSMGDVIRLDIAYGTATPFAFAAWQTAFELPLEDQASFQLGDIDGDDDLDVLLDPWKLPPVLVRNAGARAWADAVGMRGSRARFAPLGADDRVELVTQDGPTIYRHEAGDPERRVALVRDDAAILLTAADADGDGRYDLTVSEPKATFVWLRRDDGPVRIELAAGPLAAVTYPDIDGDRRPDLVALPPNGEHLFIRRSGR
ncbi:FG-GAP-like repeat-containing protein [Nannocystis sp. ILAH1]|uniref:FG-GAP-like repeat-containing protein n=1 Tax=Nannocystis sp. ILAH1 TaxID=2996789 RepID=UPI002271DC24|nr:FG-GAP-like repeat-containing protein [Nannocystis sp. ILAH1]MCY0987422.1 FG-GAP-like repeat-containing protein [Nannocystis sp. ILAH1]